VRALPRSDGGVAVNRMAIATDVGDSDVWVIYYGNRGVVNHNGVVYGRI